MRPDGLTFNADGVANLPDGMKMLVRSITLGIDEYYDLPRGYGIGEIYLGSDGYVKFIVTNSGAVTLILATSSTRNIEVTDTGAASDDLCIFDNGTTARIQNRDNFSNISIRLVYFYEEY